LVKRPQLSKGANVVEVLVPPQTLRFMPTQGFRRTIADG
jgi:hypothetical protein